MAGDPDQRDRRLGRGLPVQGKGFLHADPEFVFVQTGGDVGVSARVHIRIDTQGNRCLHTHTSRDGGKFSEFRSRLHVDGADAFGQRELELIVAFSNA